MQTLSSLPVGAKVKFGKYQVASETPEPITWVIVAKNHPGYPVESVTLQAAGILDWMEFDAKEPTSQDASQSHGNNRYGVSNIHRWLNSSARSWYTPAHSHDAPPSYYGRPGFLNWFTDKDRSVMKRTTLTESKSSLDGGGSEEVYGEVFLPCAVEHGWKFNPSDDDDAPYIRNGQDWGYYASVLDISFAPSDQLSKIKQDSDPIWWLRDCSIDSFRSDCESPHGTMGGRDPCDEQTGVIPVTNLSSSAEVSNAPDENGCYMINPAVDNTPVQVASVTGHLHYFGEKGESTAVMLDWTTVAGSRTDHVNFAIQRSANDGDFIPPSNDPTIPTLTSQMTYTEVTKSDWKTVRYRVAGIAPIFDDVSKITYGTWVYSEVFNVANYPAPVISGSDGDLGVKQFEFVQDYTITGDSHTTAKVEERIDNQLIRSFDVIYGVKNTFDVSGLTLLRLKKGKHTMTITTTNNYKGSSTRSYTFDKGNRNLAVWNQAPVPASKMPTRIHINVTRSIPEEGTLKVEVCNDGYDASPAWEDATKFVTDGGNYTFTNTTKTAEQWGVLIKVEASRGTATGDCYITEISGNFE